MKMLCTGLGAWSTIEAGQQRTHGLTFPLAIVSAVVVEAGFSAPECWEDEGRHDGPFDVVLLSAMDSRHFWEVPTFLRSAGVPVRAAERGERDPIVVVGGQAASAPAPIEPFVDVVYLGEAEAHLPELLRAIEGDAPRRVRLERAAAVPGCLVPACKPEGHRWAMVYATDIGITVRVLTSVSHRQNTRIEIARGCKGPAGVVSSAGKNVACGFCALGWRAPYRENSADDVGVALARARSLSREVHLSAGDAEGHSQIEAIRQSAAALDVRDHGWTGRADTIRDCHIDPGKQYAIGLEGASHRLRRAVGKPRLTDDYVVERISAYWAAGGRRLMFHLIGGLPSETANDVACFGALLDRLADAARLTGERQHLEVGRQPFGPLPHTPMQWFAPGLTTEQLAPAIDRHIGGPHLNVVAKTGQALSAALINSVAMRGGPEVASLLVAGKPRIDEGRTARFQFARWLQRFGLRPDHYLSRWDINEPTPWDHITTAFPRSEQERAYRWICNQLGVSP